MKTALILGSQGQDGRLLTEYLKTQDYRILGVGESAFEAHQLSWNAPVDITNSESVFNVVKTLKPEEIYYLPAYHHSSQDQYSQDLELFERSHQVHVTSFLYFLEAVKNYSPVSGVFYAASSLVFGDSVTEFQSEDSPMNPDTPYGITKLSGLLSARFYRKSASINVSTGILFNHESQYRAPQFLTKKIITTALRIKSGSNEKLTLGNLNAEVDWGYAPEYVQAMHTLLQLPQQESSEYVIATGKKHRVQDFVQHAFEILGLDWKRYVQQDQAVLTRARPTLVGNPEKIFKKTGWRAQTGLKEMILKLIEAEKVNT